MPKWAERICNRLLFEFLSAADDDEKMKETIDRNRELCNKMDEDSIRAILGIAGIKADLEDIRNKEEGKETYNMCKAFEDYKEKGRQEGILLGRQEGKEKEKTIVENMLRRNMSDEDIKAIAECTQEFVDEVRGQLNK